MKRAPSAALVVLCWLMVWPCGAADKSNATNEIDWVDAVFLGRPLFELTIDEVTDLLGRPSSTINPHSVKLPGLDSREFYVGSEIFYHDRGLKFTFAHAHDDARQRCWSLQIYLAKTWHPETSHHFLEYQGQLRRPISGSWKAKRVLEEFADMKPVDEMVRKADLVARILKTDNDANELEAKVKGRGVVDSASTTRSKTLQSFSFIEISRTNHNVRFYYEPNTRFVERINLIRKQAAK